METLIISLASTYPTVAGILAILGALMVVGTFIVSITPTTRDDEFLAKLKKIPYLDKVLKVAQSFSPIQKRPKKK